jgi:hypothetical protein
MNDSNSKSVPKNIDLDSLQKEGEFLDRDIN